VNSSEQYKRQIMNDLSQGNVEGLDDAQMKSKNTKTLMILPSAHHMKNAANCLDALYIQTASLLAKWSQNSKKAIKLNQMNGMM